jgi:hypothetical protein
MILMRLVWMQLRSYPTLFEARALYSMDLAGSLNHGCQPPASLGPPSDADRAVSSARQAAVSAFASPGYTVLQTLLCRWDRVGNRDLILMNQGLLAVTVFSATLLSRFITSSWTVALIVAAMLMSRGRLLTDIGTIGLDNPLMLVVTLWLTTIAHFLRTGAAAALAVGLLTAVLTTLFDPVTVGLPLAAAVSLVCGYLFRRQLKRPLLLRVRAVNRQLRLLVKESTKWGADEPVSAFGRFIGSMRGMLGMELIEAAATPEAFDRELTREAATARRPTYERGGLFRTLNVPFTLWVYSRRRWLKLAVSWTVGAVAALLVYAAATHLLHQAGPAGSWRPAGLALRGGWHELREAAALWESAWWPAVKENWQQRLDLHLVLSIVIVVASAVQSPGAGLPSFFEMAWLTIMGSVFLVAAATAADFCDVVVLRQMLASGVAGAPLAALGPRSVLGWIEPVWLTMGAAGVYNLMKVFDSRMTSAG